MLKQILLFCVGVSLAGGAVVAGEPPDGKENIDLSQIISSMGGKLPAGFPQPKEGLPDFKEVTKDMKSDKGLFTLWYYPPTAKDKDPEKLLCQIPVGFLGEKFMLSTSFSGGGFFTGFPLDERVVQWELLGQQLLLIEPETRFVVNETKEVADVVRRTYPDRIRTAVPLVTKAPNGDPVIDFGALLKSDFADIAWMSFFRQGMFGSGGINPALSKWTKKKTFELNVEMGVELAVSRMSPPGSYDKKIVHFSFWKLPKTDYKPRIADDRVGYFLTANQDWAKPTEARDIFNRYIDRWHLVKRDPSLALCEPKQPIIFYIEKTVPVRFRRAVRDGILEWNQAFEKVGFSNAVVVRQQTDDNEWRNLDPEDMRYSFFRWIVTGAGFAMGPHRSNPFTGQIYDADIIFDDSMVRYFEQSAERMLPATAMALKTQDPALQGFLDAHPQWRRPNRPWERFVFGQTGEVQLREAMRRRIYQEGRHFCEYAEGMKHQMSIARAMLAGERKEVLDRFLYDVIKEVVMHEVGHTIGLRHNFKASSIYSLDEIKRRFKEGTATTGSVMDYNPVLFFADGSTQGNFLTPTIGPYDHWAVEYGYRPFDASYKSPKQGQQSEAQETESEESQSQEPATDAAVSASETMSLPQGFSVDDIPPELLDQMPEHIRQMLESGAMQTMMSSAPAAGAKKPSDPAFIAPVKGEQGMLQEIARRSTEPELAYATDEDATFLGPDPRVNRFDLADDPIAWARDRAQLIDKRIANLLDWAVKDTESWYHLTQVFVRLMVEKAFILDYVGGYIGGQYFNRNHKGDPSNEPPFVLVDPKLQRDAMSFIEANLFNDEFFEVSPEVLNHLAPPRWWHQGASVSYTVDFPVHELIAVLQWWNLFDRLFPNTLRRIHDAELKTDAADKFTVAEYIQRIQDGCWGGTINVSRYEQSKWTDSDPYISDIRRSLQREYLGLMEPLVRTQPGRVLSPDLHAMATHSLQTLSDQIEQVLANGKIDFASEAHLRASKSRIDRMLALELTEYGR
ncbi:MAG: zinc-dependent metalloprotease [Planctomycetota bacterium]|nr:zinc-dependent metalloprotease [Planctomycetota bacterium]MCZ6735810.1 zinc-dependent metalloprotease [Planctomycetota bacterium]